MCTHERAGSAIVSMRVSPPEPTDVVLVARIRLFAALRSRQGLAGTTQMEGA